MTKITVLSAYSDTIEVVVEKSPYMPKGTVYFVTDHNFDLPKHLETIAEMKREHKRLQDRYDNVLRGLEYWKGKCKA